MNRVGPIWTRRAQPPTVTLNPRSDINRVFTNETLLALDMPDEADITGRELLLSSADVAQVLGRLGSFPVRWSRKIRPNERMSPINWPKGHIGSSYRIKRKHLYDFVYDEEHGLDATQLIALRALNDIACDHYKLIPRFDSVPPQPLLGGYRFMYRLVTSLDRYAGALQHTHEDILKKGFCGDTADSLGDLVTELAAFASEQQPVVCAVAAAQGQLLLDPSQSRTYPELLEASPPVGEKLGRLVQAGIGLAQIHCVESIFLARGLSAETDHGN